MAKLNMVKALNLALLQEMERDEDVVIIGEDVGVDGGVFRVTEDLHRKFGSKRVIDSPLAEASRSSASTRSRTTPRGIASALRADSRCRSWSGCRTAAACARSSITRSPKSSSTRTSPA
jgi:hypothetical protein